MKKLQSCVLISILMFVFSTDSNSEKVLSRKKRYLIFPEGSSLQLVYDQIVPYVDYENYIIFGLTVAMAWELPSKPSYPDPEETHLANRKTFEKNNSSKTNTEYQQHEPSGQPDLSDHQHYHSYLSDEFRKYLIDRITHKFALNAQHFIPVKYASRYALPIRAQNASDIFFGGSSVRYQPYARYPALRTRRHLTAQHVNASLENNHSLYSHISSRVKLYDTIIGYLSAKGETGVECVLRALCETTKVTSLDESVRSPASFANEILRAVFSLPSESLLSRTKVKTSARAPSYHQASDAGLSTEECSSKYSKCKHSIWDEDFII